LSLEVSIHEGESQESLLRRFQRMVQMSGVLREVKANSHFLSKGDAARIKAKNSARRRRRQGYQTEQGIKSRIREGRL
jgi:ribosomal protein S21